MSGPVPCFYIIPTNRYRVKLRRFSLADQRACSVRGSWGHEAGAIVGEVRADEHPVNGDDPTRYPHDAAWPVACEHCGAPFEADDAWQVFYENVYVRADGATGEHYLRSLAPGAIYDATWLHGNASMCGPDGRCLMVKLPDGREWCVDGPSTNGNGWTRTGEWATATDRPRVTARPSILTHNPDGSESYHGWLTDGVLTPC